MTPTPMMQQYHEAKQTASGALLLFRMGDFYELFFEDAKTAARILGLSLTSREKGENPTPMAGFPHHQLDGYLAKIIAAGMRAAVCEQIEDPREAKGIVKRAVTRVVSRGTVTDDVLLCPHEANFLLAIAERNLGKECGLSWIDISTGRFEAAVVPTDKLGDELARVGPVELLVSEDAAPLPATWCEGRLITKRPPWTFGHQAAQSTLTKHFGTHSLEGFGFIEEDALALAAAGAVLDYLTETQKSSLAHVDRIAPYRLGAQLEIDQATRRSLEISQCMRDGRREGSLLGVVDRTVTAMGARMLGDWFANPLTDARGINARLDAVEEFVAHPQLMAEVREELRSIYDIQRLLARVTTARATPRDLCFLARTLKCLPKVKAKLTGRKASRLAQLESRIDLCADVRSQLEAALADDCPLNAREGGFIRPEFNAELDEQRELMRGGKKWMAEYQAKAIEESGIANIKIGYNKVFGYYLEVTHTHREKVPDYFIRKQTLKNCERYITPELKEHEEKVLAAEERSQDLEYQLFVELRELVAGAAKRLQGTAESLAEIDVLAALADLARARNYIRPKMTDEPVLAIVDGRHPVLDITEADGTFVPNSVEVRGRGPEVSDESHDKVSPLTSDLSSLLLITGPNMAGKSTYIRQVALITLLAQVGSFVPAKSARIGVADRIFARVGASDDLARGRSTFMVEMTETARILNTATNRSLVILDEIGRGTSTYDGLSLAWAVVEYLHDRVGCRTLFATHYHELTDLEESLPGVGNLNVAVEEWQGQVVFLHKIVPGAADKSYGIHVAQLAGVPREVNERAEEILKQLESQRDNPPTPHHLPPSKNGQVHRTLFESVDHPLIDTIRGVDLNGTTPLDALRLIQDWQDQLENDGAVKWPR
jgi:DNA mismatch repair protein MutS